MHYNIYKNISEDKFMELNKNLITLRNKVVDIFNGKLLEQKSLDDDYLVLNFKPTPTTDKFKGNLSVVFEDDPMGITFNVSIIKTLDIKGFRYFKKESIISGISMNFLEQHISEIINNALLIYYSWSENDILNAEKISLI